MQTTLQNPKYASDVNIPSQTKWRNVGWKTTFYIQRLQTFLFLSRFFTFFNVFNFFSATFFTSMCCHTTLWKSVVNYTALQHSWFRSNWWNMFKCGKCSQWMPCLCFFLQRLICVMCLKCPPLAKCRVLSRECHWSMNASIVRCSMLCQTCIFITERNE